LLKRKLNIAIKKHKDKKRAEEAKKMESTAPAQQPVQNEDAKKVAVAK
jgi:hypothetical protein